MCNNDRRFYLTCMHDITNMANCNYSKLNADPHPTHSDFSGNNNNIMHQPSIFGYVITGLCTSTLFCILGVFCTLSTQWCQRRWKRCRGRVAKKTSSAGPNVSQGGPPQDSSEPVYAECSMPTSSQDFNTCSNVAYRHPKVNMYIYAY